MHDHWWGDTKWWRNIAKVGRHQVMSEEANDLRQWGDTEEEEETNEVGRHLVTRRDCRQAGAREGGLLHLLSLALRQDMFNSASGGTLAR